MLKPLIHLVNLVNRWKNTKQLYLSYSNATGAASFLISDGVGNKIEFYNGCWATLTLQGEEPEEFDFPHRITKHGIVLQSRNSTRAPRPEPPFIKIKLPIDKCCEYQSLYGEMLPHTIAIGSRAQKDIALLHVIADVYHNIKDTKAVTETSDSIEIADPHNFYSIKFTKYNPYRRTITIRDIHRVAVVYSNVSITATPDHIYYKQIPIIKLKQENPQ